MHTCLNAARARAAVVAFASLLAPVCARAQTTPPASAQDAPPASPSPTQAPPPQQPATPPPATPPPATTTPPPQEPARPASLPPVSVRADGAYAQRYAQRSIGLLSSSGLLALPTTSGLLVGSSGGGGGAAVSGVLGLGATVRLVFSHFVLQPTLGFGLSGFGLTTTSALSAFVITPGIGLGAAFAVGERVALSPMLRTDFYVAFANRTTAAFITVLGELPVAIFVGRNGFIEPYVDLGAAIITSGATAAAFAFGVGYRLGIVF